MLTIKQKDVLDCIQGFLRSHGRQPTLAEIGERLGMSSSSTVHKHVQKLIAKGYLQTTNDKSAYTIKLDETTSSLPLLGVIAAGKPIEAIPDVQSIDLASEFCQSGRYVLRIAGDSMIEAGILDGDYVVIREQAIAERGEIVVVLLSGAINGSEATLKYFYPQADSSSLAEGSSFLADSSSSLAVGSIELRPANSSMESLFYPADEVTIQGVVVGSFRSYQVA